MTEVKFYDPSYIPEAGLTYSVIAAMFGEKWLFVRHHRRSTWEIPGGHIEENETSYDAAERELREETGAADFVLECVSTYSVKKGKKTGYGRLYLAKVLKLGPLQDTSEIKEIKIDSFIAEENTYPDIQPLLFERILMYIKTRG